MSEFWLKRPILSNLKIENEHYRTLLSGFYKSKTWIFLEKQIWTVNSWCLFVLRFSVYYHRQECHNTFYFVTAPANEWWNMFPIAFSLSFTLRPIPTVFIAEFYQKYCSRLWLNNLSIPLLVFMWGFGSAESYFNNLRLRRARVRIFLTRCPKLQWFKILVSWVWK